MNADVAGWMSLVDCIWTHPAGDATGAGHDVLPDGAVDLIATVHPDLSLDTFFAVGAMTQPVHVPASDRGFVGIRFQPGAAQAVLGIPQSELVDRLIPVNDLLNARIARVATDAMQQLVMHGQDSNKSVPDEPSRHALSTLLHVLDTPRRTIPAPLLAAITNLTRTAGRTRISELAGQCALTRQHLGRLFAANVGLSPKQFARVCRVRALLSQASSSTQAWPSLADDFGYTDQSHLIADVRAVTGRTPEAWRRTPGSISPIPTPPFHRY